MQQNTQMNQMLSNNMSQMNQMQAMMQQMQQMMMGQNMNSMNQPNNNNLFSQAMANVNATQQPQRQSAQQYGHNDPFANIGRSNQKAPAIPKKTGPDPFAQFGLNSMK